MSEPESESKLASDEARRDLQHDAIKSRVEGDVNAEIDRARHGARAGGDRKIDQIAGTFREHAVGEVLSSEREARRSRGVARVSQFIDYAFFVLYALLAIRFVLSLIAARSNTGFVKFIASVSDPFYAPFKNIVTSPRDEQGHTVMLSIAVAFGAYIVLHLVINRLLRLIATRRNEI